MVAVRYQELDFEYIRKQAEKNRMTVSEYIRLISLKDQKREE